MKFINLQTDFPELLYNALEFHDQMIPIAMVIVLVGLIAQVYNGSFGDVSLMLRGIVTAGIIAIVIQLWPEWLNNLQLFTYWLMEDTGANPSESNEKFALLLIGATEQHGEEIGFFDVFWENGLPAAIAYGVTTVAAQFVWGVMFLALILQQVLLVWSIALSPIFIAFFSLNVMRNVSVAYMLGVISIAIWPLGWMVSDIFTQSLMELGARENVFEVLGTKYKASSNLSFFFIMVLSLWLLISTIASPLTITKLFRDGANAGSLLLASFGSAVSQGAAWGVGAGVTSHLTGGSTVATGLSSAVSGAGGVVSGALGSNNMLIPTAIGIGFASAEGKFKSNGDYSSQAQEIYEKSK